MAKLCGDDCSCTSSKRTAFDPIEVEALMRGIAVFGVHNWVNLGNANRSSFHRTRGKNSWRALREKYVNLRKKCRNTNPEVSLAGLVQWVLQTQLENRRPSFSTAKGNSVLKGEDNAIIYFLRFSRFQKKKNMNTLR